MPGWLLLACVSSGRAPSGGGGGSAGGDGGGSASGDGGGLDGGAATPSTLPRPRYEAEGGDFFGRPWPSDSRLDAQGRPALEGFPNPAAIPLVQTYVELAATLPGFGTNAPIYLAFEPDGPALDLGALPSPEQSCAEGSPLRLIDLELGLCVPVRWEYHHPQTLYLPAATLAVAPVFGFPLHPGHRHALLLGRSLAERPAAFDEALAAAPELLALRAALGEEALDTIAVATVFTTSDPLAGLRAAAEAGAAVELAPELRLARTSSAWQLFQGAMTVPSYLAGEAPWQTEGGLVFDEDPAAAPVALEELRLLVATPLDLSAPPASGWPVLISLPGTGADALDACCLDHGEGTIAALAAARGMVTLSFDLPLHGERGGELAAALSVFEFPFNVLNPASGRSVQRQAAIDVIGLVRALGERPALSLPDGSTLRLDPARIALFGHSQGGLVLGLAAPFLGPGARRVALSGAGGGVAITLIERQEPFAMGPLLSSVLRLPEGEAFTELHPIAGLVQWLSEVTDPINTAPYWSLRGGQVEGQVPRHVLHLSGLLDTYTDPRTAEALAAAGGLDARAPVVSWGEGWALAGVQERAPPFAGNRVGFDGQPVTAALWGIADQGHAAFYEEPGLAAAVFDLLGSADEPPEVP